VRQAAGYLNICVETVKRLTRNGKITSIDLSLGEKGARRPYNYLLQDLDAFVATRKIHRFVWDQDSEELPWKVMAKLLNVQENSVRQMIHDGRIPSRTYQGVRDYMRYQMKAELVQEARSEMGATWSYEFKKLNEALKRAKEALEAERAKNQSNVQ
jgi:hypothetical protein